MKEPVLATAANAVDHAVERASGSICWSEFTDGGAAGFRGPAGCAIAAEPSTRASKAIVVINFLIIGLRVGTPLTAIMVRGSSIAKLRQASHFVQMLQRAGRKGGA